MQRRAPLRRWSLAAATAASFLALAPTAASAQFSSITFFGDSFTDMGMADALAAIATTGGFPFPDPTPAPYWPGPAPLNFPGTSTDGPTWASYFATLLGRPNDALTAMAPPGVPTGNNFAISGARTGLLGTMGLPIGLQSQLGLFNGISPLPAFIPPPTPRAIDPTGLYVVWGGVNDIRDIADLPSAQWNPMILAAVDNVDQILRHLATRGVHDLLVPFAPNSAVVPEVAAKPDPAATAAARALLTSQFNTLLALKLSQLALDFPTLDIATFDLSGAYARIVADAATGGTQFGITNLTVPCFLNFGTPAQIPCDVSLFSDGLHPTTRAQSLVGAVAAAAVVPEPATVALLAGGLALLGAVGMSRRRHAGGRAA